VCVLTATPRPPAQADAEGALERARSLHALAASLNGTCSAAAAENASWREASGRLQAQLLQAAREKQELQRVADQVSARCGTRVGGWVGSLSSPSPVSRPFETAVRNRRKPGARGRVKVLPVTFEFRRGAWQRCKSCESERLGFRVGDEAHAAVSRRPPIALSTIVARTEGCTYAVKVWAVSLVQGPFSVAPCQTPIVTIRNVFIAVHGVRGAHR
jgi:hypothetical protein